MIRWFLSNAGIGLYRFSISAREYALELILKYANAAQRQAMFEYAIKRAVQMTGGLVLVTEPSAARTNEAEGMMN